MRRLVFVYAMIAVISAAIQVETPERVTDSAWRSLTTLLGELR
jgi:hypothetical protein